MWVRQLLKQIFDIIIIINIIIIIIIIVIIIIIIIKNDMLIDILNYTFRESCIPQIWPENFYSL